MSDKERFARVVTRMGEAGLLPRGKASDLVAEYDYIVTLLKAEDDARESDSHADLEEVTTVGTRSR